MAVDPPSRVSPAPQPAPPRAVPAGDPGLRRMLTWVFVALILTVLFAVIVVEITLRWFG